MEDKLLTGVRDIDMKILQNLDDSDFIKVPNICSINDYIKSICDDDTFWMNRFILKYTKEGKEGEKEFRKLQKLRDEFNSLPNLSDPKTKLEISYKQLYAAMRLNESDKGLGFIMRKDYLPLYKLIPKEGFSKNDLLNFAAQVNAKNIIISELLTGRFYDQKMERIHDDITEMAKYMTSEIYDYFVSIDMEDQVLENYIIGIIERAKNPEGAIQEIKRVIDQKDDRTDIHSLHFLYYPELAKLNKFKPERNKKIYRLLLQEKLIKPEELADFIKEKSERNEVIPWMLEL